MALLWAMATLEALVEDRLLLLGEEKASKQSKRVRLIADPGITVTALMEAVGCFMQSKKCKDHWTLVQPPPGSPTSYGWHSLPNGDWIIKTSSLLIELLSVAGNSKLHSKKIRRHCWPCMRKRTWSCVLGQAIQQRML